MAFDPGLQAKLDALWFILPAATPAAQRANRQSILVREFQIAAREPFGAQDNLASGVPDAGRLRQVVLQQIDPNAKLADNYIPHGDADGPTMAAIDAWLAGTARLRCPVIFQARNPGDPASPWQVIAKQGFAFHDELTTTSPRVFALDYTGRQPLNPNGQPPLVPVGTMLRRAVKGPPTKSVLGPACTRSQSLRSFDPEHVIGRPWAQLTPAEQATFRVTAALAHVEAGSVLDGLNAYDTSVVSVGPYHYTGFPAAALGAAELGAFIAYFAARSQTQHDALFPRMGVASRRAWARTLLNHDATYRAELGFVDATGAFIAPTALAGRDWLRTWHSLYRLQAALRSSPGLQSAIWPFARQRIQDVLATPFGPGAPPGAATLGDVFKSERTVGQLLRWHVYRPAHIVSAGVSGVVPGLLVAAAGLSAKAVGTWRDADEVKLSGAFTKARTTPGLAAKTSSDLQTSLLVLASWSFPAWSAGAAGPLLRTKRDFALFANDIPFPAPALTGVPT